jgi:hypothetical protein
VRVRHHLTGQLPAAFSVRGEDHPFMACGCRMHRISIMTGLSLDALTPSQELVIEVLTARYRLGETFWTFSTKHSKAIRGLEDAGHVHAHSGGTENTLRVALTSSALTGLQLTPVERGISDLEPNPSEHIPTVNRLYADRISAYLRRVGAETMTHKSVGRLFGSDNLHR